MSKDKDVKVEVLSFCQFHEQGYKLALDSYQRPYVWDEGKVGQLLQDLLSFKQGINEGGQEQYYFGSILLHCDKAKRKLFVIDGQQRLTSLSVLYFVIHKKLPEWIDFEYRSALSAKNIQAALKVMQNRRDIAELTSKLFEQLVFTVTSVEREDLAFTFFDTQNNRGVPLGATDLLKAFHLRAVNTGDKIKDETLQEHCARRWENVQFSGCRNTSSSDYDFAPGLFQDYLWRARSWRGSSVHTLSGRDELFEAFSKECLASNNINQIKLYPGVSNQWAKSFTLLDNNEHRLELSDINFSQSAAYLPFSLRQPIHSGLAFFIYTEKYSALINIIFYDKNPIDPEIKAMNVFFEQVVKTLSVYLVRLFRLAVLIYVDRLGTEGLYDFAQWLNYRLGALRLEQSDIRRQTPIKLLRDPKRNLLDVIAFAYEPSEVISFLKSDTADKIYQENSELGDIAGVSGNTVKARYVLALAKYYDLKTLSQLLIKLPRPLGEAVSS